MSALYQPQIVVKVTLRLTVIQSVLWYSLSWGSVCLLDLYLCMKFYCQSWDAPSDESSDLHVIGVVHLVIYPKLYRTCLKHLDKFRNELFTPKNNQFHIVMCPEISYF
jgi:hypothetical protein